MLIVYQNIHLQQLIDMASTKYQDNMGRTVMHIAAEQVCICTYMHDHIILYVCTYICVCVVLCVCVCVCACVYVVFYYCQGCAKEVNIIRSVRPTSVQDFDKQGYILFVMLLGLEYYAFVVVLHYIGQLCVITPM